MFMTKCSYEEFKQREQNQADSIKNLQLKQWMTPMTPVGTYKVGICRGGDMRSVFSIFARIIDGKDMPKICGGPIDGKAIEFHAMGLLRGYCADSEEAYNSFIEKIDKGEAETWRSAHDMEVDTNV